MPDRTRPPARLKRYERQKQVIVENTRLLLAGRPSETTSPVRRPRYGANPHRQGRGNEFAASGLKLLEIEEGRTSSTFSRTSARESEPAFRSFVFLDDSASRVPRLLPLKAAREGGAAKAPAICRLRTLQRRHLNRRALFGPPGDDEIHCARQYRGALFPVRPLRRRGSVRGARTDEYHDIVLQLARDRGIYLEEETLFAQDDRFALLRGIRSRARRANLSQLCLQNRNVAFPLTGSLFPDYILFYCHAKFVRLFTPFFFRPF